MHRHATPVHVPTPLQRLWVGLALALIFGAPALALTLLDAATGTTPTGKPVTATVTQEPGGWYCSDRAVVCGNGTGVDR